jgi:hypothetical protein
VLDGGPGVIAKEGLGLAGIEDIVMAAMLEDLCSISDTHTQVPDAYQPALNTLPNETCNRDHVSGRQRMSHHSALLQVLAGSGSQPQPRCTRSIQCIEVGGVKGFRVDRQPLLAHLAHQKFRPAVREFE